MPQRGAREIVVGLGGSATNDGGFGMARALISVFSGNDHDPELKSAIRGQKLDEFKAEWTLRKLSRQSTCETHCSEEWATQIFGPQKA